MPNNLSKIVQMQWNRFIFRYLPPNISIMLIYLFGLIYFLINNNESKMIIKTVNYVLQNNSIKYEDIIIKVFKGILDHYSEKLINAYGSFNTIRNLINNQVIYINENILIEALNQRNGVILATGHFGGIELMPSIFAIKGYPVSIICRYQNQIFSRCIRERAEMVGIDIIETNNNNTIKFSFKVIKEWKNISC